MPAKKKGDLATSEAGLALQKLLMSNGALDVEALNEILATKGIKAVSTGIQEAKYSRVEKKREWASEDRKLAKEEIAHIKLLPKVIGLAPGIVDEGRSITQDEIDLWAEELLIEREVADILEGLKQRMRSTFINVTAFENDGNPLLADGEKREYKSAKHGFKIVVTKSGRSADPDYSQLEELVGEKVWKEITDEVVEVKREVNEEKLAKALGKGKVTMDQFASIIPEKKEWPVVSPKAMKNGEDL